MRLCFSEVAWQMQGIKLSINTEFYLADSVAEYAVRYFLAIQVLVAIIHLSSYQFHLKS